MNFLKQTMKIFILALLLSVTSCQEKYPNLEDGIYAEIVTNKGTMVAKLHYDKTPVTVANFIALAEGTHPNVTDSLKGKRFYNGLTFHRVIDKFMIQGGDPTGTGAGSPGYKFPNESHPDLNHDKPGILAMANSGPDTNGSQFYITEGPQPRLDGGYTVFGELVTGLEVQDSISNVKTAPGDKPLEDVIITEVNIIKKGEAVKNYNAATAYTEELPKVAERQKKLKEEVLAKQKEASKVAAEEFLKKNESYNGTVKKLPTGLIMIINAAEKGVTPTAEDRVLINYAGYFEDGQLFDTNWASVAKENNKYDENRDKNGGYKPFPMIYNETASLVPGFREAMLNMNVGDKARIFIPSYLGYGAKGFGPIAPGTNLIFDLEITGIQK